MRRLEPTQPASTQELTGGCHRDARRHLALVVLALLMTASRALAAQTDPLAQARALYNEEKYDEAVAAAAQAGRGAGAADRAALVGARARLERFRQSADHTDLTAAREQLRAIRVQALPPRERVELLVGLAEALYLEGRFGAAAELFARLLERPSELAPRTWDRVLDWWGSALDREAEAGGLAARGAIYGRLIERMERELRRDAGSAAAAYWIAAAARGRGDLDRAWSAAIAGYVGASLAADRGAALRADLDRLVLQAIVVERVRQLPAAERDQAAAALRAEWEGITENWR